MDNFTKGLLDYLTKSGKTFEHAVKLVLKTKKLGLKFLEEAEIQVGDLVIVVLRGGPDRNPWYNFKMKVIRRIT